MSRGKVVVCSLWRNDADRDLEARVRHLLGKTSTMRDVEWLWAVGDSTDGTLDALIGAVVAMGYENRVRVTLVDSDLGGEDTDSRRLRMSVSATKMFAEIPDDAEYVLLHESDLVSPGLVIDRLLLSGNGDPIAGWPTIELGGEKIFYDIWAYRDRQGRPFTARPPYAEGWRPGAGKFRVGSFGSVWLAPAPLVRGRVIESRCVVELCEAWRAETVPMWADPKIEIVQPVGLWTPGA